MKYLVLVITLFIPVLIFGQHNHSAKQSETTATKQIETSAVKQPDTSASSVGLGDVNHPVTTTNAEAQRFFNQGLAYIYAFNHEEGVRSFKRAAELDTNLAMAYWGAALALGSNYNLQADAPQLKEAYSNLQKALALAPKAAAHERAYIEALAKRYSSDPQTDRQKLALDYKKAMSELVRRFPDDLDAATLYAESMMNLRPWQLWSADGKPAEGTLEIIGVLEGVLRRNPNHTGANHYYIHAIEASPNAERGLASALRLEKLAPKAGHLVHMPSHIYIRTGDYDRAAKSNADAIVADREYIEKSGAGGVYPMMYYNHNIHFLAAANAMKGRYADAIKAARELEANVTPHLKMMPMLEMFAPYTYVTLVRFGKWDEILKIEKPDEALKITNAFRHFARGIAFAGTNKIQDAENELKSFQAVAGSVPADAPFGNSGAAAVLKVADQMLAGKITLVRGDRRAAIEILRKAVEAEDATGYNEPPDWDLPARELLGGAFLLLGENLEAERAFRDEIAKHPRNGRALFGLVESLRRQNKTISAQMVEREFAQSWADADTKLRVEDLAGVAAKTERAAANSNNLRYSEVKLKTGVRLRYAEQGDPNGTPVILLHGYGDSSFSYSRVLPLMSAKYRIFALDQRGHGGSDRPASGYKFADFAADVLAFMDAKNLKRAIIVGHSMGSFVAQQVAVSAPERVEKLILVGSATTVRNAVVSDLQKAVNELKEPVSREFVRDFQYSVVHHAPPDEFMNRVIAESLKVPARVWRDVMAGMLAGDARSQLGKIKAPTLIVWGDKETVFLRDEQDGLVSSIPNAVLKVYAETGHCPNWEKPEQFVKDFEEFVAGQAALR